jgi:hypothetical protein
MKAGFTVLLFVCAMAASAQSQRLRPSTMPAPTGSASQPVSNSALVTWVARYEGSDTGRLELLVVWRGAPGWYQRGPRSMSGGGSGDTFHSTNRFGDLELQLDFESAPGIAHVQGKRVELHGDNVILVDGVDKPGVTKVAGTLRIGNPTFSRRESEYPPVGAVLRRSAEVLAFAGCDTQQTPAKPDRWCEQLQSK